MAQQPMEASTPEQMDIPEGMVAHGEPLLEQRKKVMRKEKQRGTAMY